MDMSLNSWIAASASERNQLRKSWSSVDFSDWYDLLTEACNRLRIEYGQHPLILRVLESARFAPYEPAILVATQLHRCEIIEELPSRYCGFLVLQEPGLDGKECFLKEWQMLFGNLMGWTPAEVLVWASLHYGDDLDHKVPTLLYHRSPDWYVAQYLMKNFVGDRFLGMTVSDLERAVIAELKKALANAENDPMCDWRAVRQRIEQLISLAIQKEFSLPDHSKTNREPAEE